MGSALAYAFIFLTLPLLTVSQPLMPAIWTPPMWPVPNPAEILAQDGRFTTLLTLLRAQNLVPMISVQRGSAGITIFAPTNAAFEKIASDLPFLSNDRVKTILLYHGLDKYVSFANLDASNNPFKTLAGLTLNFTGGNDDKNVTSGRTNTKVEKALYDLFPLAIFPVEDVLFPPTPTAEPPPKVGGPSGATPGTAKSPAPPSAASMERVWWGALMGGVIACMSLF